MAQEKFRVGITRDNLKPDGTPIFDPGVLHDFCAYVSVWGQMGELSKGIVDLRRLVLDLTLVALPLFITVRAVDAWRWG